MTDFNRKTLIEMLSSAKERKLKQNTIGEAHIISDLPKPKHPDHVKGWNGSLADLAEAISNMRYDSISDLIGLLSKEISDQALGDRKRGKTRLSIRLSQTAHDLEAVMHDFNSAWKICEPYMPLLNNIGKAISQGNIENTGE